MPNAAVVSHAQPAVCVTTCVDVTTVVLVCVYTVTLPLWMGATTGVLPGWGCVVGAGWAVDVATLDGAGCAGGAPAYDDPAAAEEYTMLPGCAVLCAGAGAGCVAAEVWTYVDGAAAATGVEGAAAATGVVGVYCGAAP